MRRRRYEGLPPVEYKLLLQVLREDGYREYPIIGWPAIGAWLVKMGLAQRPPIPQTLRKYQNKWLMPVRPSKLPGHCKPVPYTTNILLHAWIGSQGRAMHLPRWHPFRQALEKVYSQKQSAVRMRRMRERQIKAEALAAGTVVGVGIGARTPDTGQAGGTGCLPGVPVGAFPSGSGQPGGPR